MYLSILPLRCFVVPEGRWKPEIVHISFTCWHMGREAREACGKGCRPAPREPCGGASCTDPGAAAPRCSGKRGGLQAASWPFIHSFDILHTGLWDCEQRR